MPDPIDDRPIPEPTGAQDPTSVPGSCDGAYEGPRLTIFGSVRTITANVGSKGKRDGGPYGYNRTGF